MKGQKWPILGLKTVSLRDVRGNVTTWQRALPNDVATCGATSRRGREDDQMTSRRGKVTSRRGKLTSRRGKVTSRRGNLTSRRGKVTS